MSAEYPGLVKDEGRWLLDGRPLPPRQAPSPSLANRWNCVLQRVHRGVADEFKGWPVGYLRFCDELGLSPWDQPDSGLVVDRIDTEGSYAPGNIRLTSPTGNMRNRVDNVRLDDGTLLADLAWRAALPLRAVYQRWLHGDRDPARLTRPLEGHGQVSWRRSDVLGDLAVYSVGQPTSAEYPGHYAIPVNLAGCHVGCEFCFSRELWARSDAKLGWDHVTVRCRDYSEFIDAVVWGGGDALEQDIAPFLAEVHRKRLYNKVYVTPNHAARLRRCLEDGLIDAVHYSVKPSSVPGTDWRRQKATLEVLAEHPEVDTELELVYTRADEPEISELLDKCHEVLPDHEVKLTRAINPDYLRGDTL